MKMAFKFALIVALVAAMIGCGRSGVPDAGGVNDADGKPVVVRDTSRIVVIGTSLAETVQALGAADRVVGVDNPSTEYLPQFSSAAKVGSRTTLNAEGILSRKPSVVILTSDCGPPQVIEQLRGAGIPILSLTPNYTIEQVKARTSTIAALLGLSEKGAELNRAIDTDLEAAKALLANKKSTPKVMFVGRGPNMPNATMSGTGTTIDEMIKLAGGENPMKDFTGFRPMTDEAVVAAAPDIILMTEKSFERSGGIDGVLQFPGVSATPAGRDRRIVAVSDMYFQGFGPGVGKAVRELAMKFFPELKPQG